MGFDDAGAPQMPALLFSLASWPMAGADAWAFVFLTPACDHKAPKASPPDAGFAADEAAAVGCFAPPPRDGASGCCCVAGICTDWK